MNIWERTKTALIGLSIPLAASQYINTGGTFPDTFIVYSLITSPAEQHADDAETMRSYLVQVSCFCRNGLTNLPDVESAMKSAGFMRGPSRELPYSTDTGHFGLATDFIYLEQED